MAINRNDYNFDTDDDDILILDDESYENRYDFTPSDDSDDEEAYIDFEDAYDDEDYDDEEYESPASAYERRKQFIISEIISYIKIVAAAFIIAFFFTKFIIINATVPTGSMRTTIMEGDQLIGLRLAYTFSEPQRGDVVIFKFPDNENENYVKRIIGIPGDVIQIINGQLYVNSELAVEEYIAEPMNINTTDEVYIVPEDSYFVLGDNRNHSHDSRAWSTTHYVPRKNILAKVLFKYYNKETKQIVFQVID